MESNGDSKNNKVGVNTENIDPMRLAAVGTLFYVAEINVLFPVDVVRTRLQVAVLLLMLCIYNILHRSQLRSLCGPSKACWSKFVLSILNMDFVAFTKDSGLQCLGTLPLMWRTWGHTFSQKHICNHWRTILKALNPSEYTLKMVIVGGSPWLLVV
jgi:hypothetical protein